MTIEAILTAIIPYIVFVILFAVLIILLVIYNTKYSNRKKDLKKILYDLMCNTWAGVVAAFVFLFYGNWNISELITAGLFLVVLMIGGSFCLLKIFPEDN